MSVIEVSHQLNDAKFDGLVLLFDQVEALDSLCGDLKSRVVSYQAVSSLFRQFEQKSSTAEKSKLDNKKLWGR